MKKNTKAGSLMTKIQKATTENTCKKVLYRETDKCSVFLTFLTFFQQVILIIIVGFSFYVPNFPNLFLIYTRGGKYIL